MSESGKMFYQTNPTTFWIITIALLGCFIALGLSSANFHQLSQKLDENKQKVDENKQKLDENKQTLDESKNIIRTKDFGIQTKDKSNNTHDWSFTSGCENGSLDGGKTPFDASSFFCIKVITTDKDGKKIEKNVLCMDPTNPGDFTKKITCAAPTV